MKQTLVEFIADRCDFGINATGRIAVFFLAGAGHYLRLQRYVHRMKSDPGVHFECDGEGWGDYGAIASLITKDRVLEIRLHERFESEFDGRLQYRVVLGPSIPDWSAAREFLRNEFLGDRDT